MIQPSTWKDIWRRNSPAGWAMPKKKPSLPALERIVRSASSLMRRCFGWLDCASATAITFDDLIELYYSLREPYREVGYIAAA